MLLFGMRNVRAQGGGPPMITDDPGITDLHKFEINTSFNSSFSNGTELAIPLVDANYGLFKNVQLNFSAPLTLTINHHHTTASVDDIEAAVKIRFLNQEKGFVSAAVYPRVILKGDKGYLLPLLLERTIGRFLIGSDIGYFIGNKSPDYFQLGSLVGYQATPNLQLMAEYFYQKNHTSGTGTEGYINIGFRQTLNKTFTLMGSFGSQVVTPMGESQESFISFLGIQSVF